MNIIKLIAGLAIPAASLALAACQSLEAPKTARLKGSVDAERAIAGPFVIAAYDRASKRIAHRVYLERAGDFDMLIDEGQYKFVAFADLDRDGQRGAGEPVSVRMTLASAVRAGDRLEIPALHVRTGQAVASAKAERAP
jgi:hypothetical protein